MILYTHSTLFLKYPSIAKEIKLAYYKEAKKCHPDLNPNDKKAKEKFQELSKAYEILSDEKKKRAYDYGKLIEWLKLLHHGRFYVITPLVGLGGFGMDDSRGQSSYDSGYTWEQNERSYEDIFRSVQADADIISEAWKLYSEDLKEEMADVYEVCM